MQGAFRLLYYLAEDFLPYRPGLAESTFKHFQNGEFCPTHDGIRQLRFTVAREKCVKASRKRCVSGQFESSTPNFMNFHFLQYKLIEVQTNQ